MRIRTTLPLLGLGAMAALAGCGSSHHSAAVASTTVATTLPVTAPASTSVPSPTVTGGPVTTAPTTTAAPTTTTPGPTGPQPCQTAQLIGRLANPNGAAGTIYYTLELTHIGPTTCTVTGYAGVSFVTNSAGTQVGAAARRDPGSAATVTLAPGQSAGATLGIVDASNYGSGCGIVPVAGLRVYPPGNTGALFVPHEANACSNSTDVVLHVAPFKAA